MKNFSLLALIIVVSNVLGAYFVSSLKKKSETYPAREDNVRALLREKMEAIIDQTYALELWLEQARSQAINGNTINIKSSPIAKISMYQKLYFRELQGEMNVLSVQVGDMMDCIIELAADVILSTSQNKPPNIDLNRTNNLHIPLLEALDKFRKGLINQYASKIGLYVV